MIERLEATEKHYLELSEELTKLETLSDINRTKEISKEMSSLEDVVMVYRKYKKLLGSINDTKEMVKDPELGEMAKEDLGELEKQKEKLEKDIAKLKKQENLKRTNKQSWKGEIGDDSFVMLYSTLYNSTAYRDLKPISKDIYIGMVLYAKGNFITEYPHRIYKNICSKNNTRGFL